MTDPFLATWTRAQLAEVAWRDADGRVDAAVVVPLRLGDRPALALPFDRRDLALALASASEVRWSVTSPDLRGDAEPRSCGATVAIVEDLDGARDPDGPVLAQLLAKYPPDRRRLDSILLRREHAWYVPRLVVESRRVAPSEPTGGGTVVGLVAVGGDRLRVGPVRDLDPAAGTARVAAPDGPAVLLVHGADVPDLERPWRRRWRGTVASGRFEAEDRDDVPPRDRPLGLVARLRVERQLGRACRAGLRAAGHR